MFDDVQPARETIGQEIRTTVPATFVNLPPDVRKVVAELGGVDGVSRRHVTPVFAGKVFHDDARLRKDGLPVDEQRTGENRLCLTQRFYPCWNVGVDCVGLAHVFE